MPLSVIVAIIITNTRICKEDAPQNFLKSRVLVMATFSVKTIFDSLIYVLTRCVNGLLGT